MNYKERVVTEKHELDKKIEKLLIFIYSPNMRMVDEAEQSRLRVQLQIMEAYSTCLGERIAVFGI